MQADTQTKPQTETEKLFALDKPSLENLSYVLRHPDAWPEGFVWDFSDCETCAMGLARGLWDKIDFPVDSYDANKHAVSAVARAFAMPYAKAKNVFMGDSFDVPFKTEGTWWWKTSYPDWSDITPEMVADQIDEYLAEMR